MIEIGNQVLDFKKHFPCVLFTLMILQSVAYAEKSASTSSYLVADSLPLKDSISKRPIYPEPPNTTRDVTKQGLDKQIGSNNKANLAQTVGSVIQGCMSHVWRLPISFGNDGIERLSVQVEMELDRDGAIMGELKITPIGGDEKQQKIMAITAKAALMRCSPFNGLPVEHYDSWHKILINLVAPTR